MTDVTPRRPFRVAVLGGDGRFTLPDLEGGEYVHFKSCRYGGNGPLKRLAASLRQGSFDRVVLMIRWNSHSATEKIRALCKQLEIPVEVIT